MTVMKCFPKKITKEKADSTKKVIILAHPVQEMRKKMNKLKGPNKEIKDLWYQEKKAEDNNLLHKKKVIVGVAVVKKMVKLPCKIMTNYKSD